MNRFSKLTHTTFNGKTSQLFRTYYLPKEGNRMARNQSNQIVVPGAQGALDAMKQEIAAEFGVHLGPDTTSRANGSVGGEITKRLVAQALGGLR